jgi:hypothetical protein
MNKYILFITKLEYENIYITFLFSVVITIFSLNLLFKQTKQNLSVAMITFSFSVPSIRHKNSLPILLHSPRSQNEHLKQKHNCHFINLRINFMQLLFLWLYSPN